MKVSSSFLSHFQHRKARTNCRDPGFFCVEFFFRGLSLTLLIFGESGVGHSVRRNSCVST